MAENKTLLELVESAHKTSVEHGFWPNGERNFGESMALITSELSEALEENRSGNTDIYVNEDGKPEGELVELIDAAIRLFDMIGRKVWEHDGEFVVYDAPVEGNVVAVVDLDGAFQLKADYNRGRAALHGRKY